tara:strand:- start:3425 stop:3730 length:306 start_codon:yes stop_codon:yes gene_type:complete
MIYLIIAITVLFFLATYYCLKFAIIIINIRDAIEESLDIIDNKYTNISKILEIPIFYDSYEVRSALNELEDARNSLLNVANKLSDNNLSDEEVDIEYYEEN